MPFFTTQIGVVVYLGVLLGTTLGGAVLPTVLAAGVVFKVGGTLVFTVGCGVVFAVGCGVVLAVGGGVPVKYNVFI